MSTKEITIDVHKDDYLSLDYLLKQLDAPSNEIETNNLTGDFESLRTESIIYKPPSEEEIEGEISEFTDELTINSQKIYINVYDIPDSVVEHLDYWWEKDEGSGTVTIDSLSEKEGFLSSNNWSENDFTGELTPHYDGVDDHWITSDRIYSVNDGGESSVLGWFYLDDDPDEFVSVIELRSDDNIDSRADDSLYLVCDGDGYQVNTVGSYGESWTAGKVSGPDASEKPVFFVILNNSIDGSSGDITLKLYDDDGFDSEETGSMDTRSSQNHGTTPESYIGVSTAGQGQFMEGTAWNIGVNESVTLSNSEIDDIWSDTKP